MDAVEAANSGHPGMPMGMADIAEVLWNDYLRFAPTKPHWCDRDRFVLSNGHGSMLLYSVAYLTGYALGIDEIKNFRQLGSRAPVIPSARSTSASRRPRGRSVRASRTRSAWRSPSTSLAARLQSRPTRPSSITTPMSSAATAA